MAQSVTGGTSGRRSGTTRSGHSLVRGIDFVRHRRVMLQGQKISRQSQVTVGSVPSDHVRAEDRKSTSELQSPMYLVCRLLLEKKNIKEQSGTALGSSQP